MMDTEKMLDQASELYEAENLEEATALYQQLADAGSAQAQYFMGNLHASGEAGSQDYRKAFEWFQKAASQDHPEANLGLGLLHEQGLGVPVDLARAAQYFAAAAEKGEPNAQFNLGRMHKDGLGGLAQSAELAAKWVLKSAENGYPPGFVVMAALCQSGNGVPVDLVQAYRWARLSADAGNEGGDEVLNRLEQTLTSDQIDEALESLRPDLTAQYADLSPSKRDRKIIGRMEVLGLELDRELSKRAKGLGLKHCVYATEDEQWVYPLMDLGGGDYAMEEVGAVGTQPDARLKELLAKERSGASDAAAEEMKKKLPIQAFPREEGSRTGKSLIIEESSKRSWSLVLSGLALVVLGAWQLWVRGEGFADRAAFYANIWIWALAIGVIMLWKGFGGRLQ